MSSGESKRWWPTVVYYLVVFAGFGLLVASVFLVPRNPLWLVVLGPLVFAWSVWLLNEYWRWVRNLGR